MRFNIRAADRDDLIGITDLWRKLSIDQMSKDPYYKGSMEFKGGQEQIAHSLNHPDCCIYLAEADDRIAAFIEVWLYNRDFHFFADDYAYILHFIVDEPWRKHKDSYAVMYRLFKSAENWAISKGRKYLVADVFNHNQKVVKLLEHVGLDVYRYRLAKNLEGKNGEAHECTDQANSRLN